MSLFCYCLNVKVKIEHFSTLKIVDLKLTPLEKSHSYFQKELFKASGKEPVVKEVYSQLTKNEIVGSWNIFHCYVCKLYTHAFNYVSGLSTFSSALQERPIDISIYGREKLMSYSRVFNICLPYNLVELNNESSQDTNFDNGESVRKIAVQANSFLEMAQRKLNFSSESVEGQETSQTMQTLSQRVREEEKFLKALITQAESAKSESLHHPSFSQPMQGFSQEPLTYSNADECTADELQNMLSNLQLMPDSGSSIHEPEEGVFEMDEAIVTTDADTSSSYHHDDIDEDDLVEMMGDLSATTRFRRPHDIARSAPLNVPHWPTNFTDRDLDSKKPSKPEDIGDSMRRMARRVRMSSVDAFGDLP